MQSIAVIPTQDFNWELTYRFKGEDYYNEDGVDYCYHDTERPVMELSFTGGRWSTLALKILDQALRIGSEYVLVPIWPLMTALKTTANASAYAVEVLDVNDFISGGTICFVPPFSPLDGFEYQTINYTHSAGTTIFLNTQLLNTWYPFARTYPYPDNQAYVMPGFFGIATVESFNWYPTTYSTGLQFANPGPAIDAKVKIQGEMYKGTMPALSASLDLLAHSCAHKAPKVYREVLGASNGVLSLVPYGDVSKLVFECHWDFFDTSWRTLRNQFLAARGRSESFHVATGMFEVKATRTADAGSTTVYLDEQYSMIRDKYPQLRAFPLYPGGVPFTITTTAHASGDAYTCSALPKELRENDKLCLAPLVRFDENSLTLKFNGIHKCTASATFRAVTS